MVIVITGASRGLGLCMARRFASAGHTTYAGVRKVPCVALENIPNIIVLPLDVDFTGSVASAAGMIPGQVDVLINNAAILNGRSQSICEVDPDDFSQALNTNVTGPLRVLKYFVPKMVKGGLIMNISSEAGSINRAGACMYAYTTSKAAVNMLSRSVQFEFLPQGIRVLAVHPGRMDTDMGHQTAQIRPEEAAEGLLGIAEGRILPQSWFVDYRGFEQEI